MATSHEPLGSRLEELSAEENLLDETEREEVTQQVSLWEVQCQVHLLCCELRGTDTTDPALPPEMPSTQDVSVERLRGNLMELRGLVQNLLDHSETMDSLRCGGTAPETQLQRLKEELQEAKELLSRERERARSSQQEVSETLSVAARFPQQRRAQPGARRLLRSFATRWRCSRWSCAPRDGRSAKVRAPKNAMEMELAKCKIDMMSLNSQLLDAIQQKLHLSQQLEAWQVTFYYYYYYYF
uniref:BICD family like cargo adaptor 1 n=1 Tax=Scleropages formosus TaxID=113540 RepID=A0A8C9VSD0_SCLFO